MWDIPKFKNNGLPIIATEITINGNGSIIERSSDAGTPSFRIFLVDSTGDLTLNDVTLTGARISGIGGSGNGAGILNLGILELNSSTITANSAQIGGGISNQQSGTVTLTNTTVSNNSASSAYGGIQNAEYGTMTLLDSTISGNTAGSNVGGIGNGFTATVLTITNSTISGNTAAGCCGGIANAGTLTLTDSTVSGNIAGANGGGIASTREATITNCDINNNTASTGGGISGGGTMTLTNTTISDTTVSENGGGITNGSGLLVITNSTISNNIAGTGGNFRAGAGIYNGFGSGEVRLTNTTISGNEILNFNFGGGISSYGKLTFTNSTITDNTANVGAGLDVKGGTVDLKNTIIAGNTNTSSASNYECYPSLSTALNSLGHNLDRDGSCIIDGINGDITVSDPGLDSLADNGGPTQTHALLAGSPAIDAGSSDCPPPATDQRGVSRPQDGDGDGNSICDIGAFELGIIDTDSDGIEDQIDGQFVSGSFIDESNSPSNNFTDQHLGGTSFGSIVDDGGLIVTIEEAANPSGFGIGAGGGAVGDFAIVNACALSLLLTDGDSVVITCGSLTAEVLAGPVDFLLGKDIVATVHSGTTVTITEIADGEFEIENSPESTATIIIKSQGQVIEEIGPAESIVVTVKRPRSIKEGTVGVLSAAKTGDKSVDRVLSRAIRLIEKSLDDRYWIDENHLTIGKNGRRGWKATGKAVFTYEWLAVSYMQIQIKIWKKRGPTSEQEQAIDAFEEVIPMLVNADELLAEVVLDEARGAVSPDSHFLEKAEAAFERAQRYVNENRPGLANFLYKRAWIYSQLAIKEG